MHVASITGQPAVEAGGVSASIQCLTDSPIWQKLARVQVIDICTGGRHLLPTIRGNHFYHVVAGSRIVPMDKYGDYEPVMTGYVGRTSGAELEFVNYGREGARIIVMSLKSGPSVPGYRSRFIADIPWVERPAQIRLKSLWSDVQMPGEAGYEFVDMDDIAPRHRHTRSAAVWLILNGSGEVGMDLDGVPCTASVSPGSYGCFPAGTWHGFAGKMTLVSAQVPGIAKDYEFDEEVEYNYEL